MVDDHRVDTRRTQPRSSPLRDVDAAIRLVAPDGPPVSPPPPLPERSACASHAGSHDHSADERERADGEVQGGEVGAVVDELDLVKDQRARSSEAIVAGLVGLVRHNAEVPGLVQLYARISNEAARDDHPSHEYFRERYRTVQGAFTEVFARLQQDGRLPEGARPDRLAVLLVAMVDGLQTQWMYDGDIDMADHLLHFFDVLGVRRGALES